MFGKSTFDVNKNTSSTFGMSQFPTKEEFEHEYLRKKALKEGRTPPPPLLLPNGGRKILFFSIADQAKIDERIKREMEEKNNPKKNGTNGSSTSQFNMFESQNFATTGTQTAIPNFGASTGSTTGASGVKPQYQLKPFGFGPNSSTSQSAAQSADPSTSQPTGQSTFKLEYPFNLVTAQTTGSNLGATGGQPNSTGGQFNPSGQSTSSGAGNSGIQPSFNSNSQFGSQPSSQSTIPLFNFGSQSNVSASAPMASTFQVNPQFGTQPTGSNFGPATGQPGTQFNTFGAQPSAGNQFNQSNQYSGYGGAQNQNFQGMNSFGSNGANCYNQNNQNTQNGLNNQQYQNTLSQNNSLYGNRSRCPPKSIFGNQYNKYDVADRTVASFSSQNYLQKLQTLQLPSGGGFGSTNKTEVDKNSLSVINNAQQMCGTVPGQPLMGFEWLGKIPAYAPSNESYTTSLSANGLTRFLGTNMVQYRRIDDNAHKMTYASICAMAAYQFKSYEELRYEDMTQKFSSIKAKEASIKYSKQVNTVASENSNTLNTASIVTPQGGMSANYAQAQCNFKVAIGLSR